MAKLSLLYYHSSYGINITMTKLGKEQNQFGASKNSSK